MIRIVLLALIAILIPETAYAHTSDGSGFYDGLTHPIMGMDHLLAMLSIGILSTQIGHRHIWAVPSMFVLVMLIGGAIGMNYHDIPKEVIEYGIIASVVTLGLVIAMDGKLNLFLIYLFVSMFGFFHGYAHGREIPSLAQPVNYASGYVLSTIMIHIVGVIIGYVYAVGGEKGMTLLRYTGACIMGAGLQMLMDSIL